MRFDDISGSFHVKRALEVAAAGGHTIRFFGEGQTEAFEQLARDIGVVVASPADITVEVPLLPPWWKSDDPGEPHERIMGRIEAYVARDLPMGELAETVLRAGCAYRSLTPSQARQVASVALTIANLAGDQEVHAAYVMEAMQYAREASYDSES